MDSYYKYARNSALCLLVFSVIGCTGPLQRKVSTVSNPCKSRNLETLQSGSGDPSKLRLFAVADAKDKSVDSETVPPCQDEHAGSKETADSVGFVENIKAGFTQAKNSFRPNSSEISESYLGLVRSQQDFCKNRNAESKENQKPYNSDRDIFRGLDGVLLKIIPFYIFNH